MRDEQEIQIIEATLHNVPTRIDQNMLPEVIRGQIIRINELNLRVKEALEAAAKAENKAQAARKLSAGWSLTGSKKKEAIEGLQEAGVQLADAVQAGAKAQKLAFEFQTRLADSAKYLFNLGVSNIAANRTVVRELERRLAGASEEELSELAREEVTLVVRQLKEQEDLLRKHEEVSGAVRGHETKIDDLLGRTDDLIQLAERQQGELVAVKQRASSGEAALDGLRSDFADARKGAEAVNERIASRIDELELKLNDMLTDLRQASQYQQEQITDLLKYHRALEVRVEKLAAGMDEAAVQSEAVARQLRFEINLRSALLALGAIAAACGIYILR